MAIKQVTKQEEYESQGLKTRQEEEVRAKAHVRELAEAAAAAGYEEWEDLSDRQRLNLAAALIRAENRNWARFEYVTETWLAKTLPLQIAQAMEDHEDRFSNLGRELVVAALDYAAHAGQEALDQARERLAVHQIGLSEEECLDRRERARDMIAELSKPVL